VLVRLWHKYKHLSLSYWGIFPQYEDHSLLAAGDAVNDNYWVYVYVGAFLDLENLSADCPHPVIKHTMLHGQCSEVGGSCDSKTSNSRSYVRELPELLVSLV